MFEPFPDENWVSTAGEHIRSEVGENVAGHSDSAVGECVALDLLLDGAAVLVGVFGEPFAQAKRLTWANEQGCREEEKISYWYS